MKLKSFIGVCIACTVVVIMTAAAHAETYSVGVLSNGKGHVDDTAGNNTVDVPVVVTPDADEESASVNGYIMTFTYDPRMAAPKAVEGTENVHSKYATVGTGAFADAKNGIIVSDIINKSETSETLVVAWAAAEPVEVAKSEDGDQTGAVMADVQFTVKETTENIPIAVEVAQLAQQSDQTAAPGTYEVAQGTIDLVENAVLYGDANLDGIIDTKDSTEILKSFIDLGYEWSDEARVNADVDGVQGIDTKDATEILKSFVEVGYVFPVEKQ